MTFSISLFTMSFSVSASSLKASNTSSSWTWSTILLLSPASVIFLSTPIMAFFMMSAEDPCIGAFMAFRSASDRTVAFFELMSGR